MTPGADDVAYAIVEVDPGRAEATEPLGTKPKYWYVDDSGGRRLFKIEDRGTGEDWAEKVACELARLLRLPHVEYDLAIEVGTGRRGVVCSNFSPPPRSLVLGNQLLLDRDPSYPRDGTRYRVRPHTIGAVSDVISALSLPQSPWGDRLPDGICTALDVFVGYVMLDAYTANQDRHHENWGATIDRGVTSLAPSFDHGAALARNLNDSERERRLKTRDKRQTVPAFARRASSAFYSDLARSRPLTTVSAFLAFSERGPEAAQVWLDQLSGISEAAVDEVLGSIPGDRMSEVCKQFAKALLTENWQRLLAGDAG